MEAIFAQLQLNLQNAPAAQTLYELLRFLLPALVLWILIRCIRSMLFFKPEPEIWAWLSTPNNERIAITHWESLLGRGKRCDAVLEYPTISRTHAVLTRYDDGSWSISDVGSKGGVKVNGEPISMSVVKFGDRIELGGVEFVLVPITKEQERIQASVRTQGTSAISPAVSLLLLTLFQFGALFQTITWCKQPHLSALCFGVLIVLQWLLFAVYSMMRRKAFDCECLAFFLCTMSLCIISSSDPSALIKQTATMVVGVMLYVILGLFMRNLERVKAIRYFMGASGIGLLLFNLVFGVAKNGARNWVQLGALSFQPSELVKICFIFAGASTLQRLMTKRNLFLFICYSAVICACLALMNDFGTAIIFFCTFLVIAFLRSGDFATIALACTATGFAGVFAFKFKPYIAYRVSGWGHVWQYALSTGYQQTRAMMCIASGGLFGLGCARGWLHYVAASDTDLVFAFIGEEWGLIMAVEMVVCIVAFALFVAKSVPQGRSSFYSISATAAATIMVLQTILNVFGTVDFLPLTGVTFPFVSNGGSSMLCVWCLLAFIKAADTRQNASIAIRLPSRKGAKS